MVTAKLWAGLGNQMFMIAAVIGYAKKHGLEYHIPPVTMNPRIWKTYFPNLANHNYKKNLPVIQIHEQQHSYQELEFKEEWRNCNIELIGYWQSEKYFEHCREYLLKLFEIKNQFKHGEVAIHIRRGDYLKYPDKHPVVSLMYIDEALSMPDFKGCGLNFYSDDPQWTIEHCGSCITGGDPFNTIKDMAEHEHQVISNSSFSWWAAWLNTNPDKIVIAPKIWFGPGNSHLDTKDLIPSSWIRI